LFYFGGKKGSTSKNLTKKFFCETMKKMGKIFLFLEKFFFYKK